MTKLAKAPRSPAETDCFAWDSTPPEPMKPAVETSTGQEEASQEHRWGSWDGYTEWWFEHMDKGKCC
jgi:hypothetical protein